MMRIREYLYESLRLPLYSVHNLNLSAYTNVGENLKDEVQGVEAKISKIIL